MQTKKKEFEPHNLDSSALFDYYKLACESTLTINYSIKIPLP